MMEFTVDISDQLDLIYSVSLIKLPKTYDPNQKKFQVIFSYVQKKAIEWIKRSIIRGLTV